MTSGRYISFKVTRKPVRCSEIHVIEKCNMYGLNRSLYKLKKNYFLKSMTSGR